MRRYLFILLWCISLAVSAQDKTDVYRNIYDKAEQDYAIGRIEDVQKALQDNLSDFPSDMLTSVYRYPILTPQIEYIMSKATKKFKRDPYVNDYYTTAQENEKRMQGFDIDGTPAPAASSPVDTTAKAPVVNVPQE
jgi:hypothetical protein